MLVTTLPYNNKQIMTGLEGNRLSICPERFRIASPRVSILTEAQPRSIGTLWAVILNLKRQIDNLLPEQVTICFIIPLYYSKEKMITLIGS